MANENLSPVQQLDEVLKFLATSPFARPYLTDAGIHEHLKSVKFDGAELLRILNKLKKDNYIDFEDRQMSSNSAIQAPIGLMTRVYWITWEGKLFAENDGYMGEIVSRGEFTGQQIQRAKEEAARIKALEVSQEKMNHSIKASQKRMEIATWVMAGGSLILASIEIIKLCSHHN
jgi:hypothetical protein